MIVKVLTERILKKHKIGSGKVRDKFWVPSSMLLMLVLVTDRVSAFDRVVGKINGRGQILNAITLAFKRLFSGIILNDIFCDDDDKIAEMYGCNKVSPELKGRLCVVWRANVFPVELIVRFIMTGSLWKEYKERALNEGGFIWGIWFPEGLKEGDLLPCPVFTPSTKAETGHDVNISYDEMLVIISDWLKKEKINMDPVLLCQTMKSTSLALATIAREKAARKNCDILDTKFEMGVIYDYETQKYRLCIVDELLTPDSSRVLINNQHSDKQILRDYLEKEVCWDKESNPPQIPLNITNQIIHGYQTYMEAVT
jgi:phosphoribosylaminoimidazole-succinocarboxamide synthase